MEHHLHEEIRMTVITDPNLDYRAYRVAMLLSEYLDMGELVSFSLARTQDPTVATQINAPKPTGSR